MESQEQYTSSNVYKQLAILQQKVHVGKDNYNSFGKYKYRKCEDILEAVKPLLAELNSTIVLTDSFKELVGIVYVEATARFICGSESVEVTAQAGVDINKKGMDIAQTFGASSSYARKYALSGLLLLDDRDDADATNKHDAKPQPQKSPSGIYNAGSNEYQELFGLMTKQIQSVQFVKLPEDAQIKIKKFHADCMTPDSQPAFEDLKKWCDWIGNQYVKLSGVKL